MSESFDDAMRGMFEKCYSVMDCDLRGTDECNQFDSCTDCRVASCRRLRSIHEHDMELAQMRSFARGYQSGQRSMDASRYAVKLRLRQLDFDGGSHENLHKIAYAVYPCATGWTGWTCESAAGLRDELIRLLGGIHDEPVPVGEPSDACGADCDCGAGESRRVTYDELGNERYEAVCELRKLDGCSPLAHGFRDALAAAICVPRDGAPYDDKELCHLICDRLIHLLGGDEPTAMEHIQRIVREHDIKCLDMEPSDRESFDTRLKLKTYAYIILEFAETLGIDYPNGSKITDVAAEIRKRLSVLMSKSVSLTKSAEIAKSNGEDGGEVRRITDELRECIETATKSYDDTVWHEMGDDTEAEHTICHITEAELLRVADGIDKWFKRLCDQQEAVLQHTIDDMVEECDELRAKLDEADAAIANWREREKSFAESERLREELTHDVEMWRDRAEDMHMERDELQAKLDAIREAIDE